MCVGQCFRVLSLTATKSRPLAATMTLHVLAWGRIADKPSKWVRKHCSVTQDLTAKKRFIQHCFEADFCSIQGDLFLKPHLSARPSVSLIPDDRASHARDNLSGLGIDDQQKVQALLNNDFLD